MNAAEIATALGGESREGRAWRCRCPLHGGRSLVLRDGDAGRVLATCWGGCERIEVLDELRQRGLLGTRDQFLANVSVPRRLQDDQARIAHALNIWRHTRPGAGTIVADYLATRGIYFDRWPAALRFDPRCPRPRDEAGQIAPPLPAMVALIEHVERGPIGVHCTYLKSDGTGKADLPPKQQRACFGSIGGGAVRFGVPRSDIWLVVGEGVESALSAALPCGLPCWAAISASGIEKLVLPTEAAQVLVCGDNDLNGRGQRAAYAASRRWLAENRRVRVALPPAGQDFNDLLRDQSRAPMDEMSHVA